MTGPAAVPSLVPIGLAAGSTDPVGPAGWGGLAWLGLLLYAALFVLALRGLSRLGADDSGRSREDR